MRMIAVHSKQHLTVATEFCIVFYKKKCNKNALNHVSFVLSLIPKAETARWLQIHSLVSLVYIYHRITLQIPSFDTFLQPHCPRGAQTAHGQG